MKAEYRRSARNSTIEGGDRVLLLRRVIKPSQSRKFHLPWTGVYRVLEVNIPNHIILSCTVTKANPFKMHLNQLKKLVSLEGSACSLHAIPEEDEDRLLQHGATKVTGLPGYGSGVNGSLGDLEDVDCTQELVQIRQQPTHE